MIVPPVKHNNGLTGQTNNPPCGDVDFQTGYTLDGLAAGKIAAAVIRNNESQRGFHIRR